MDQKKTKKHAAECIELFLFVIVAVLIAYKVRGIYPFGTLSIEGDDGYHQHVPLYFYVWDVLHGVKNPFYDWNTALGCPMNGAGLHFGLLSPLHLFFLFIPRDTIPESLSFLALIRFILCAFSFRYKQLFFDIVFWPICSQQFYGSLLLLFSMDRFNNITSFLYNIIMENAKRRKRTNRLCS